VSRPVFKTGLAAITVAGEFDSLPPPPYMDPALQIPSFENFWSSGCGHIFGFLVSEFGLSLEP
jgi:hypothetical protein